MKRIIVFLLVFSIFTAPLAWAIDTHKSAFEGHVNATLSDAALDHKNTSHDAEQTDHCDHFLSHFTTLLATAAPILKAQFNEIETSCNILTIATDFTPPYRPPIL